MLKPTLVASMLFLFSISVVTAAPLDAAGTVYIDGLPCNRACQDYMAWSRQASGRQPEVRAQPMAMPSVTPKMRQTKKSEPRPITPRTPPAAELSRTTQADKPAIKQTKPERAAATSVPTPPPDPRASAESAMPLAEVAAIPNALEPARESPSAAPPPSSADNNAAAPLVAEPRSNSAMATDTEKAAFAIAKAEQTIAILLVRDDIKSVADMSNKRIAIDASQTGEVSDIKTAINKAGATNVEVSEDTKFALGRVMDGEVPAGIITLASPEEAAQWTGVPGFTVLRLPVTRTTGNRG